MPISDYQSVEELFTAVEAWPALSLRSAETAMHVAVDTLHEGIPQYPSMDGPVQRPDGASFLTDKQRAWFFWAVGNNKVPGWGTRDGKIEYLGSARNGDLGRSFTEEVTRIDNGVLGVVGTAMSFAPWVVGPSYPGEEILGETMYQARIHEERWWIFEDEMANHLSEAWARFDETFWVEFGNAIQRS